MGAAAYMLLGEEVHRRPELHGQAFNFSNEAEIRVIDMVGRVLRAMKSTLEPDVRNEASCEIRRQCLNAARARQMLQWIPLFTLEEGLDRTIKWY